MTNEDRPQSEQNDPNIQSNHQAKSGNAYTGRIDVDGNFIGGNQTIHAEVVYLNQAGEKDPTIPNMLPRSEPNFTGRKSDLSWINRRLAPGKTLVVSAPGGMGKTTLSVEAVYQLHAQGELFKRFPDGIIYHTFYGERGSTDLAFAAIVTAFGQNQSGDVETQVRQLLGDRRVLIMLDGCEDVPPDEGLKRVTDALGRNSGVLITTRETGQGRLGEHHRLGRLAPDEALELLNTLAGGENPIPAEIGRSICTSADQLPLTVNIAGNYLRETGEDPADYLRWLEQDPIRALDQGATRRKSIYRMVEKSVQRLTEPRAHDTLLALGQLAYQPLPHWMLEGVMGLPERSLGLTLGQMGRYGLISRKDGQITCAHAHVHGYCRTEELRDKLEPSELFDQIWRWLIENLEAWQAETPANFSRCHAVLAQAMGVLARLEGLEAEAGWKAANQLIWALGPGVGFLALQGRFVENTIALETGIRVCQKLGNRRDENAHLNNLGGVFHNTGQVEKSIGYFEQGLVISREMENQELEGQRLGNLGIAFAALGRTAEAIEQFQQALDISREIGNRIGEGRQLGNLGLAYANLGRTEEAIEQYQQALGILREIGNRRGEGIGLGNLGSAYNDLGRTEEAIEHHQQALDISREIGDRRGEGQDLGNLGSAYRKLGKFDEALRHYEDALTIAEDIGDILDKALWLVNMGFLYKYNLEDPAKAKTLWVESLAIFEKIGSPHAELVRGLLNDS